MPLWDDGAGGDGVYIRPARRGGYGGWMGENVGYRPNGPVWGA